MKDFVFSADDFVAWASRYPRIQPPSATGSPIRVVFTALQRDFIRRSGAIRMQECIDVTVKPRQMGMSTLCLLIFLFLMREVGGVSIGVVGADEYVVAALRRKFQIILSSLTANDPRFPAVKNENASFCMLGNGSSLKWLQAGKREDIAANAGRGDTFHILQFTEFAFWQNARMTMDSILPGMGRSETAVIIDSTSNGVEGDGEEFYKMARAAESQTPGFTLFFWPWFMDPTFKIVVDDAVASKIMVSLDSEESFLVHKKGLTAHQIAWRRNKKVLMGDKFQETYPETFDEAFTQKNASIFEDKTMKMLRSVAINEAWPAKIDPTSMMRWADAEQFGRRSATMLAVLGERRGMPGTGVWFFSRPAPGEKFVVAIDGSKAIHDFQSIAVVRRGDRQLVALARLKETSLDLVADVARVMSSIFHNAPVGVEEEVSGMVIWRALAHGTPELVVHQDRLSDAAGRPWPHLFGEGDSRGLRKINKATKGGLVYLVKSAIDGWRVKVVCREMYAEMVSFVKRKDGTYGTRTSADHDDILMSYGHGLLMCEEAGDALKPRNKLAERMASEDINYGVMFSSGERKDRVTADRLHEVQSGIRIGGGKRKDEYDFFD